MLDKDGPACFDSQSCPPIIIIIIIKSTQSTCQSHCPAAWHTQSHCLGQPIHQEQLGCRDSVTRVRLSPLGKAHAHGSNGACLVALRDTLPISPP